MFNRWVSGKQTAIAGGKGRRPYLASECRDLDQADKWRQEILREVGKLVMEIQNAGLGEHRLRDTWRRDTWHTAGEEGEESVWMVDGWGG